jgi:hypothetical protein
MMLVSATARRGGSRGYDMSDKAPVDHIIEGMWMMFNLREGTGEFERDVVI